MRTVETWKLFTVHRVPGTQKYLTLSAEICCRVWEERDHLSDAVLVSMVICCMANWAVAQLVVPFGLAEADLFPGCPVVSGTIAASK